MRCWWKLLTRQVKSKSLVRTSFQHSRFDLHLHEETLFLSLQPNWRLDPQPLDPPPPDFCYTRAQNDQQPLLLTPMLTSRFTRIKRGPALVNNCPLKNRMIRRQPGNLGSFRAERFLMDRVRLSCETWNNTGVMLTRCAQCSEVGPEQHREAEPGHGSAAPPPEITFNFSTQAGNSFT